MQCFVEQHILFVPIYIELTLRTSMHTEAINLRLNREGLHCIGITQPGTKIARKPTSHPRMGSNSYHPRLDSACASFARLVASKSVVIQR